MFASGAHKLVQFLGGDFGSNDTVAVAMYFAMNNGQICFSPPNFFAISSAVQQMTSDCGCDAVVPQFQRFSPNVLGGSISPATYSQPPPGQRLYIERIALALYFSVYFVPPRCCLLVCLPILSVFYFAFVRNL